MLRPVPRPTARVRRTVAAPTALLLAALLATAGAVGGAAPASARAASDTWVADQPYTGGFPDPTVVRLGSTYVASATTTANLNLPVMTSTDLVTWRPRPALENWADYSTWRRYDEAMVTKPTWAATRGQRDRVALMSQWAPSLAKVGDHYLAAFSAAVRLTPRHSCLGIAVASDPSGSTSTTRRRRCTARRGRPSARSTRTCSSTAPARRTCCGRTRASRTSLPHG